MYGCRPSATASIPRCQRLDIPRCEASWRRWPRQGRCSAPLAGASAQSTAPAQRSARASAAERPEAAGGRDGADVVDLTTGQTLFSCGTPRCRGCRRRSRSSTRPRPRCCASGRTRGLTTRVLGVGTFDVGGGCARHALPEGRRRSDVRLAQLRPLRLRRPGRRCSSWSQT